MVCFVSIDMLLGIVNYIVYGCIVAYCIYCLDLARRDRHLFNIPQPFDPSQPRSAKNLSPRDVIVMRFVLGGLLLMMATVTASQQPVTWSTIQAMVFWAAVLGSSPLMWGKIPQRGADQSAKPDRASPDAAVT